MIVQLLIALAAGAASALMFASIVSGALVSVLLFYLAPLPLMVAALGWSPLHAAIGGIAAGTTLGFLFGMPYLAIFVLTIGLPSWWLGYLAMLGRPAEISAATPPAMEWYPPGRLLLWIATFASITTIAALLTLGTDAETITAALRRGLLRMMGIRGATPDAPTGGESTGMVDALLTIAPAAAAIAAIMTLTLNLWLAGRITLTSGRLKRAWPDLTAAALPPMTLVALCVAMGLSFAGGLVAIVAQIVSACLLMAYALTGLATLHALTRGRKNRALWLSSVYAVVTVFGWPVLALIVLGLADAMFDFRRRVSPPTPTPTA
ncbi:MAG: hypothetical protein JWR73_1772 [Tardiphaga sp.]|nr:hypothetical protein [Tardiphaga sp.]